MTTLEILKELYDMMGLGSDRTKMVKAASLLTDLAAKAKYEGYELGLHTAAAHTAKVLDNLNLKPGAIEGAINKSLMDLKDTKDEDGGEHATPALEDEAMLMKVLHEIFNHQ